jgi:Uma2 family endonuclease
MAVATQVSVAEYLSTSYKPDREYVDGELREKSVGEIKHSFLQGRLIVALDAMVQKWKGAVLPECRYRVSPERFRIPDISVLFSELPEGGPLVSPPFLCIEILSPDDRMTDVLDRVRDYLDSGVKYVWVIDPKDRNGQVYTGDSALTVRDQIFFTESPEIRIDLKTVGA